MKKTLSLILVLILSISFLASCKNTSGEKINYKLKTFSKMTCPDGIKMIPITEGYAYEPFSTDKNDNVTYTVNAMWHKFGAVDDGTQAVNYVGNEACWFEWNAMKLLWNANDNYHSIVRNQIIDFPQTEKGFIWSWGDRAYWPDDVNSLHFDGTFRYVNAVALVIKWENDLEFLNQKDKTVTDYNILSDTVEYFKEPEIIELYEDKSKGRTVGEKLDKAMEYIMETLDGKNGLIKVDNDRNTGDYLACSSTYWDNYPTGYYDAYLGMLFPSALQSYADIKIMQGETETADRYLQLRKQAIENYNDKFWDSKKGRYICTENKNGEKIDIGWTTLNLEAISNGVADSKKVESIYSWLNGTRKIKGDDSIGKDIYAYQIAPRSNTVAVENVYKLYIDDLDRELKKVWWNGISNGISVFASANFGQHVENGGAIFYTSYYDIMARINYLSPESAMNRLSVIANEFEVDQLMRDPINSKGADWQLGVIGEFPESGIVPMTYLYGYIGVNANAGYLTINPKLPKDFERMTVCDVGYGKKGYTVTVTRKKTTVEFENGIDMMLSAFVNGKVAKTCKIYVDNSLVDTIEVDKDKLFDLTNIGANAGRIVIE